MAKKIRNNGLVMFLASGVVVLFVAVLVYVRVSKNNLLTNSQIATPPLPTIFPDQPVQIPADWKTKTENFSYFNSTVVFKYPPNWFIEKSSSGGRENYAVLYSSDREECIGISVSQDQYDLEKEIDTEISGQVVPITKNTVIGRQTIIINGRQGLIEQLSYKKSDPLFPRYKTDFYAGDIDFGITNLKPESVYIVLTSCSLNEKDIFNVVFHSIEIK